MKSIKVIITIIIILALGQNSLYCQDSIWNKFQAKDTLYYSNTTKKGGLLEFLGNMEDSVHVFLNEGTYYINNSIWLSKNNQIIEGIGEVNIYCESFESNVMWLTGKNIHLNNLHLKHSNPGNLEPRSCSGRVLSFDHAENIIISDCDLNGCGVSAIHDNGGNRKVLVLNNHIHNNSLGAYTNNKGDVMVNTVVNTTAFSFSNNLIENNGHHRINESIDYSEDFLENNTRLFYPYFELQLYDFVPEEIYKTQYEGYHEYELYNNQQSVSFYQDDNYLYPFGLKVDADTLYLSENLDYMIKNNLIKTVPIDTNLEINISYSFEHTTIEAIDWRTSKEYNEEGLTQWTDNTKYMTLEDSSGCYYRMPEWRFDFSNEIKNKYNLKDTSLIIPREFSIQVDFTKEGKLYYQGPSTIILKIEVINAGSTIDTKYIIIHPQYGC